MKAEVNAKLCANFFFWDRETLILKKIIHSILSKHKNNEHVYFSEKSDDLFSG